MRHILLVTAACVFSVPAMADEAEDKSDPSIVVTATRFEQAIERAPAAVTLVTSEDISDRNVSRITDALLKTPGLFLGRGENGQSAILEAGFSLRGMSTNRTLVLLDGLQPLQNGNSQGVNWLTVFPEDIERIEVVPGAFGALYGSNAIGGVINNITKRPNKREVTVRLRNGFGDAAGEWPSVYLRGPVVGGLSLAAGIAYNRRDSYISEFILRQPVAGAPGSAVTGAIPTTTREGVPSIIVGDRGAQPWRQINGVIKAEYEFSPDHRIYGGFAYADATIGFQPFNTYLRTATGQPFSSGAFGFDGRRYTVAESNFVGSAPLTESSKRWFTGYVGTVGDVEIKAELARIDREFKNSTIGTGATATSGPGTLSTSPNHSVDFAATASFPIGSQHKVVAGVSRHSDTVNRRVFVLTNWRQHDTTTTVNNGYDGESVTTSAFVQDAFSPIPEVTLYAGARLDHWETEGDFFQNIAPLSQISYAKRSETSFNPKLAAVVRPVPSLNIRAAWGRSFRSPSNLDLYSTTVSSSGTSPTGLLTVQSDPNLQPERGSSWEVGADWHPVPEVRLFGSYYRTRLRDFIGSKQIDLSLTQRINVGRASVRGAEVGMTAKPLSWLTFDANMSFIDAQVDENDVDPASVGKRLTQVPRRIAYAGITATPGRFVAVIEARYSSKIFITARNADTFNGVPGAYDPHTLVNAKLGYRFNPMMRLNLSVNNLLDERTYQFALLAGRNATAELVFSF
jgi:iron complex outermembrane receptor protein